MSAEDEDVPACRVCGAGSFLPCTSISATVCEQCATHSAQIFATCDEYGDCRLCGSGRARRRAAGGRKRRRVSTGKNEVTAENWVAPIGSFRSLLTHIAHMRARASDSLDPFVARGADADCEELARRVSRHTSLCALLKELHVAPEAMTNIGVVDGDGKISTETMEFIDDRTCSEEAAAAPAAAAAAAPAPDAFSRGAAPLGSAAAADADVLWTCVHCTFVNSAKWSQIQDKERSPACSLCDKTSDALTAVAAAAAAAAAGAGAGAAATGAAGREAEAAGAGAGAGVAPVAAAAGASATGAADQRADAEAATPAKRRRIEEDAASDSDAADAAKAAFELSYKGKDSTYFMAYYCAKTARSMLTLIPSLTARESASGASSPATRAPEVAAGLLLSLAKEGGAKAHEIFGTGFDGGGSQCKSHYDSTHSILIVLRGVKRVRLAKFAAVQAHGEGGGGSQRAAVEGSCATDQISFARPEFDLFDGSEMNRSSSSSSSSSSSDSGSDSGSSGIRCVCGGRAVEVELRAGDAMLIPKNAWHAVQSTPGTLALSIQLAGLSPVQ